MKIIEKIEIKYFRSFADKKIEITNLKDVNIFSGANDSGKSNVLRALNLFFNNEVSNGIPFDIERDLSKLQIQRSEEKAEEKRADKKEARQRDLWVKIKLHFKKDKKGMLPTEFFVEKTWDKNGLNTKRNSNVQTGYKKEKGKITKHQESALEGQLTQFLNSFSFEYIPAIKDRNYIHYLFQKLQNSLFEKDESFKKQSERFNKLLETETNVLFEGFKVRSGIKASFKIPETLLDFFRTLGVDTENGISLFERGDGIQMQFIPEMLDEIERNTEAKKIIWGFEEPENCYEPLKAFQIAQQFLKYAKEKQIFITTHSFPFISLRGDQVSSYRVKKENNESKIGIIDWRKRAIQGSGFENDTDKIEKELGLLETYEKLSEHLGIEQKKQENKNHLYVEDEKVQIYKIVWLKLKNVDCDDQNFQENFDQRSPFVIYPQKGRGELRKFLDLSAVQHHNGKKIIGVFDFDDGFNDFNGLNNKSRWNDITGTEAKCLERKRKDHANFHVITIPVPTSRATYAKKTNPHNYLTIEHLFEDDVLKKIKCCGGEKNIGAGGRVRKINGKKNLWKKLFDLPSSDFENFRPLFAKIEELFKA